MRKIKTPVCIVGAGPAGTSASLFLSKYGIEHVLLEREQFPRDKVCGETFSGRVSHVLNEIDPSWETSMEHEKIIAKSKAMQIHIHPEGIVSDIQFPEQAPSMIKAQRRIFDDYLLQKARASSLLTYIDNVFIKHFAYHEQGVLVSDKHNHIQIDASLVILCTGEEPPTLKQIFPDYPLSGDEYLFLRRYYNINHTEKDYCHAHHIFNQPFPYLIFTNPLPKEITMVEIVISSSLVKKHKINLSQKLDSAIAETAILNAQFGKAEQLSKQQGTSLLIGKTPRKLSAERFMLTGSAMGSIHPAMGFGVGHAMRSGQLAAQIAANCVQENNYSAKFLRKYDNAIKKSMNIDFQVNYIVYLISKILAYNQMGWLRKLFMKMLVSKRFQLIVTAPQYYKKLNNPIFYFKRFIAIR